MMAKIPVNISNVPLSTHDVIFREEPKQDGGPAKAGDSGSSESSNPVEEKEFFWDRLLFFVATVILALTAVDVLAEYLRGSGSVTCYTDANASRQQGEYVNKYCTQHLSWTENYPIFIFLQGVGLLAPHYLWKTLFGGQFDFFFTLARKLDRLRDPNTGEYSGKNVNVIKKLEQEFQKRKRIFRYYTAKLVIQLPIWLTSIVVNPTVFHNFNTTYLCPTNLNNPDEMLGFWPLDDQVNCIYSPFKLLRIIQVADYIFLVVALIPIGYGILWCVRRHTTELGYAEVAKFCFTSSLPPESFVHKKLSFWKPSFSTLRNPCISNDLDFLLMRLFRADSGLGLVFKDVQIEKELKELLNHDNEQLSLILGTQKDAFLMKKAKKQANSSECSIPKYLFCQILLIFLIL